MKEQCILHLLNPENPAKTEITRNETPWPWEQDFSRLSQADRERLADTLRFLGNPSRLTMLIHLLGKEMNVTEIKEATGYRQPMISRDLRHLEEIGLVQLRIDGRYHYYSATPNLHCFFATLSTLLNCKLITPL